MNTLRVGGKLAPRIDPRTLQLAQFVRAGALPPAPIEFSNSDKVDPWPMYGNDTKGDCTIAGAAHLIQLWAALEGKKATPALRTVLSVYARLSPNDQGCVMLDVLRYWRKTGIAGHHLYAFAAVSLKNPEHVKLAISMFGGVYCGLALPKTAEGQVGKTWDVPASGLTGSGAKNSWGGHCVPLTAFDPAALDCITWGAKQKLSWKFLETYGDEAYVPLTQDWKSAPVTSGIDFPALQAALGQLGTVKA